MTDKTPAMTELPEPELGYIETDKSRQPAFSAWQMREALQSAQPAAAVSDEAARLAEQLSNIANGVRICGVHDRHFVSNRLHEIARAILALRPQSESDARRAAQEQLYTERERHTAEVKRLQAEIGRLQSLRPQAVPMTGKQARLLSREELAGCCGGCASNSAIETWMRRAIEKFCEVNGITAPAGGEGQA